MNLKEEADDATPGIRVRGTQLVGPFHGAAHTFLVRRAGLHERGSPPRLEDVADLVLLEAGERDLDVLDSHREEGRIADLVDGMTSSSLDLPAVAREAVAALRDRGSDGEPADA